MYIAAVVWLLCAVNEVGFSEYVPGFNLGNGIVGMIYGYTMLFILSRLAAKWFY